MGGAKSAFKKSQAVNLKSNKPIEEPMLHKAWADVSSVVSPTASDCESDAAMKSTPPSAKELSETAVEEFSNFAPSTKKTSGKPRTLRILGSTPAIAPSASVSKPFHAVGPVEKAKEDTPVSATKAPTLPKVGKNKKTKDAGNTEKDAVPAKSSVHEEPVTTRKTKTKKLSGKPKPVALTQANKGIDAPQKQLEKTTTDSSNTTASTKKGANQANKDNHASGGTEAKSLTICQPSPPNARPKNRAERRAALFAGEAARRAAVPDLINTEISKTQVAAGEDAVQLTSLNRSLKGLEKAANVDKTKLEKEMHDAETNLRDVMTPLYMRGVYFCPLKDDKSVQVTKAAFAKHGADISKENLETICVINVANHRYRQACVQVAKQHIAEKELATHKADTDTEGSDEEQEARVLAKWPRKVAKVKQLSPEPNSADIKCPVIESASPPLPPAKFEGHDETTNYGFDVPLKMSMKGAGKTEKLSDSNDSTSEFTSPPRASSFEFNMPSKMPAADAATVDLSVGAPTFFFGGLAVAPKEEASDADDEDSDQPQCSNSKKTKGGNASDDSSDTAVGEQIVDVTVTSESEHSNEDDEQPSTSEPPSSDDVDTSDLSGMDAGSNLSSTLDTGSEVISPTSPVLSEDSSEIEPEVVELDISTAEDEHDASKRDEADEPNIQASSREEQSDAQSSTAVILYSPPLLSTSPPSSPTTDSSSPRSPLAPPFLVLNPPANRDATKREPPALEPRKLLQFPSPPSSTSSTKHDDAPSRRMNTQIGITTLREFLLALPRPGATHIAKTELITAFLAVSAGERDALGLDVGPVYEADAVLADVVLQHRIFLGHVKIAEFLGAVAFDGDDVAVDRGVVKAWEECAVKDEMAEGLEMRFLDV